MMEKQFYVYILASTKYGTLYIGVTSDLLKRIWQHKTKAMDGFTSRYDVTKLVWFEVHANAESAIRREKRLKFWRREWKIQLIEKTNPEWCDLYVEIGGDPEAGSNPSPRPRNVILRENAGSIGQRGGWMGPAVKPQDDVDGAGDKVDRLEDDADTLYAEIGGDPEAGVSSPSSNPSPRPRNVILRENAGSIGQRVGWMGPAVKPQDDVDGAGDKKDNPL